jgi:septum formation protein
MKNIFKKIFGTNSPLIDALPELRGHVVANYPLNKKTWFGVGGCAEVYIEPADIDETPEKGEKPSQYVKRMAKEKALFVANKNKGEVVLASDTIIVCGTTIIQKSKTDKER